MNTKFTRLIALASLIIALSMPPAHAHVGVLNSMIKYTYKTNHTIAPFIMM